MINTKNIQTSNFKRAEQVIFFNIFAYKYTYVHTIIIVLNLNLQGSRERVI